MRLTTLAIIVAVAAATTAWSAGDPRVGQERYSVCAGCHGFAGEGNVAIGAPKLAGLETWDLARQIEHFRRGLRGYADEDVLGQRMATMGLALTDERATEDVLAYLATLPNVVPERTVTGDQARGREQYALCAACHGANGEGNTQLSAPKLAGLDDWYVAAQLVAFKNGTRGTHPEDTFGQQMRGIAALLDAAQINDVTAFIATF